MRRRLEIAKLVGYHGASSPCAQAGLYALLKRLNAEYCVLPIVADPHPDTGRTCSACMAARDR